LDSDQGALKVKDIRFLLIPGEVFPQLYMGMEDLLGRAAGPLLYNAGKSVGGKYMELIPVLGIDVSTERGIVQALEQFSTLSGMGRTEVTEISLAEKRIVIRIYGLITALGIKSKRPVCHLVRGVFAKSLETVTGERAVCEETKCVAVGDEYCEFVLHT